MKKRIMVVDDDPGIRRILLRAFTKNGYEPTCFETAEQALETLGNQTYQVYFLDLQLPGMNGNDLCRKIRHSNQTAIIHAMTGYASVFQVVEAREAGFDDYFKKPFDLNDILKAAEYAFEKINRWKRKI